MPITAEQEAELAADPAASEAAKYAMGELMVAQLRYAGLVVTCWAGLAAQRGGYPDPWRPIANQVPGALWRRSFRPLFPAKQTRRHARYGRAGTINAEVRRLRLAYAQLVAACWAGLAAARDGDPDPWRYIREQVPPAPAGHPFHGPGAQQNRQQYPRPHERPGQYPTEEVMSMTPDSNADAATVADSARNGGEAFDE